MESSAWESRTAGSDNRDAVRQRVLQVSRLRAERILAQLNRTLRLDILPRGYMRDVWVLRHDVLVVAKNWQCKRIPVEAKLVPYLPTAIGYPEIKAHGVNYGRHWMLQKKAGSTSLYDRWNGLSAEEASNALEQVVNKIRILHKVEKIPPEIRRRKPLFYVWTKREADAILSRLLREGWVSRSTASRLSGLHKQMREHLKEVPWGLIHGDLHLGNVMWDSRENSVGALLDFESAGWGPVDCEFYKLYECLSFGAIFKKEHPKSPNQLRSLMGDLLSVPGAEERWRGYAVARQLWMLNSMLDSKKTAKPIDNLFLVSYLQEIARGNAFCLGLLGRKNLSAHQVA